MKTHPMVITSCDLHLADLHTRMPFKYGIATMIDVPHAFVRVEAEIGGTRQIGIAADLLPPKWFTKDPDKPVAAEVDEMIRVIRHAAQIAIGTAAESPFALWQQLYVRQLEWAGQEGIPPLLANFGTSLIERAFIEATARASQQPFHLLVHQNKLGIDLGKLHGALRGSVPSDFLPHQSLCSTVIRHTVGLLDPLRDEEIPADQRLHDGLPQSLAACIRAYGLQHFKIKISGRLEADVQRLRQIARLLRDLAGPEFRFTLDGNEQFHSLADFQSFWNALQEDSDLNPFLRRLMFVEQPLHRAEALKPELKAHFAGWPDRPPIIIDESDATLESLPAALDLGYAGTSHKNCKGVFKGIINRCLLSHLARTQSDRQWLMSGEDLCTIGPVSLLQDLAVMSLLGVQSVERNGHHYFAGLSMFPKPVQEQVLACHGDLYTRNSAGWPQLNIQSGAVQLNSILSAPFGVGFVLDLPPS